MKPCLISVTYHLLNILTQDVKDFFPEHKCFRAERIRINSRKNFKFSLNFSTFLLKFS